ncbi:hypothetical protein [Amycolatopsis sp. NPDC004378]
MNVDQLTSALAAHDADPDAVLSALHTKRRRRVRNRGLAAVGLAAAVVAALVVVWQPWTTSPQPAATAPPDIANGCGSVSLRDTLAMARQSGASVLVANGSLTRKTVADNEIYYEMVLSSVQTLSGPPITSGTSGWIGSGRGPAGPIPSADTGALWAPDGRLFAIAWPARQTGTAVGPILRIAPVAGDQVIFSTAGCWDTTGLPSRPYSGSLAEIPGSNSYTRSAANGFHAVPLATVEQLLAG